MDTEMSMNQIEIAKRAYEAYQNTFPNLKFLTKDWDGLRDEERLALYNAVVAGMEAAQTIYTGHILGPTWLSLQERSENG